VGHEINAVVPERNKNITKDALKDSLTINEPRTKPTEPSISAPTPSPADVDQLGREDGKVVLQFGWSDTDTSKIDSALYDAGIVNFKKSDSSDKGLGITVVTEEQANTFKKYTDNSKKIFANILSAKGGLSSTDDLRVSFSEDAGDKITFGGSDYGGIVTDDPSKVLSGPAKGEQKGDDVLKMVIQQ
jgi:hypothetical protein